MQIESSHIYRLDDSDALSGQTIVHDEYGIRYVLITPPWKINNPAETLPLFPLAEGGQGSVYLTENPNVILKFAKKNGNYITEEDEIKKYRCRTRYISTLPLPPNNNITMPETFAKGYAGYRMVFLDGLCSVQDFFMSGKNLDNERFAYIAKNNRLQNYLLTGALSHRLTILGKTAIILARLHTRGISYGDISPNNIFLPRNQSESEVWFIDPDNLVEEGNSRWSQCIGTDPYCSPEVCDNECCNLATDTFSFAELAFHLLADRHPFHGDAYDKSDLFVEEKNDPRSFSWICDPGDETNRANLFISTERLFSKELMKLFWQTFVAGKEFPEFRPPMSLWPTYFFKELDELLYCQYCGMSFISVDNPIDVACPICKNDLHGYVQFTVYSFNGHHVLWRIKKHITSENAVLGSVQRRAIAPFCVDDYDQEVFLYSFDGRCMTIQKLHVNNFELIFYNSKGQPQEISVERTRIPSGELQSGYFVSKIQKFGITVSRKIVCQIFLGRQ